MRTCVLGIHVKILIAVSFHRVIWTSVPWQIVMRKHLAMRKRNQYFGCHVFRGEEFGSIWSARQWMSRSVGFERTSSGNSHDGQWRHCKDYIGTYASRRYLTDERARLRIIEFGYTPKGGFNRRDHLLEKSDSFTTSGWRNKQHLQITTFSGAQRACVGLLMCQTWWFSMTKEMKLWQMDRKQGKLTTEPGTCMATSHACHWKLEWRRNRSNEDILTFSQKITNTICDIFHIFVEYFLHGIIGYNI